MTPPATFRQAIHALCDRLYPQHDGGRIVLRMKGGAVRVEIPPCVGPSEKALSEIQEAIVEALSKCIGEPPITGEDLAKMAGYEKTGGAWNRAVKGLIEMGMIENCRPGYRLRTEATA